MKCLFAIENRLFRNADEFRVRGPAGYAVWSELLDCFDDVLLVARVRKSSSAAGTELVNGPNVSVHGLPDFSGLREYAVNSLVLRRHVRQAVAECDAYILQAPGVVGRLVWRELRRSRRPYAMNVMGDPWDALGPGTLGSWLRPVYRLVLTREMRRMCSAAHAVLYWSRTLKQHYSASENAYTTVSPRIVLPCGFASADLVRQEAKRPQILRNKGHGAFKIGFIGTFEQLYKGPDTLLHAVRICSKAGLEVTAFLVGEGRCRQEVESLRRTLSIQDKIVFLGQLPFGKPIVDFLDSLDLFVMPSRAEGLPRALVEGMARGCPCIGSRIGGIPELLHPDDLIPPGDAQALAEKILEVAGDRKRLMQMSLRNLERAKEFDPEILHKQRADFYLSVKLRAAPPGAREGGITLTQGHAPLAGNESFDPEKRIRLVSWEK